MNMFVFFDNRLPSISLESAMFSFLVPSPFAKLGGFCNIILILSVSSKIQLPDSPQIRLFSKMHQRQSQEVAHHYPSTH